MGVQRLVGGALVGRIILWWHLKLLHFITVARTLHSSQATSLNPRPFLFCARQSMDQDRMKALTDAGSSCYFIYFEMTSMKECDTVPRSCGGAPLYQQIGTVWFLTCRGVNDRKCQHQNADEVEHPRADSSRDNVAILKEEIGPRCRAVRGTLHLTPAGATRSARRAIEVMGFSGIKNNKARNALACRLPRELRHPSISASS